MKTFKQFLFERQMSSSGADLDRYIEKVLSYKVPGVTRESLLKDIRMLTNVATKHKNELVESSNYYDYNYLNEGILDKIVSKVGTIKKSILNNVIAFALKLMGATVGATHAAAIALRLVGVSGAVITASLVFASVFVVTHKLEKWVFGDGSHNDDEQEDDKINTLRDFVQKGKELPAVVERDFKRNFAYIFGKNSVVIDRLKTRDFYDDIIVESSKRGKEIVMRFTYNGSKLRKVYNTRNPQIYLDQDEFEKFFANACREYNDSEAVNKLNRYGMKKIFLVPGSEYSEYGLSYEYSMIKTKALDVAEGHFECIIKIEITDDRF